VGHRRRMLRLRLWLPVLAAVAIGCGGASTSSGPGDDGDSGAGGSTTDPPAGAPGVGGSNGGAGGAGASGVAGVAAGAGQGGNAGAGATTSVPGESERETELLAPLFTDDETIAQASGEELVELANAIGMARGYAMCRCAFSPNGPPDDIDEMLRNCAAEESGVPSVSSEDRARCITEHLGEVEGLEEHLRCYARRARPLGALELTVCETGMRPEWPPLEECTPSPAIDSLIIECASSYYCADGSRVIGGRCNAIADCPDLSDEMSCLEDSGHDLLICGNEIWHPQGFCLHSMCGLTSEPPMCDTMRPDRFLCEDDSDVDVNVVCDRVNDCPDGHDEAHCLR
jgi:hypothetical protein